MLPGSCCWIQSVFAVAEPPPDDHRERRVCRNSWHQKGKFHDPPRSIDRVSSYREQTRKRRSGVQREGGALWSVGGHVPPGHRDHRPRLKDTLLDTPTQTCPSHDSASRRLYRGGIEDVPLHLRQHGCQTKLHRGPKLKAHFRPRGKQDKHRESTPTGNVLT